MQIYRSVLNSEENIEAAFSSRLSSFQLPNIHIYNLILTACTLLSTARNNETLPISKPLTQKLSCCDKGSFTDSAKFQKIKFQHNLSTTGTCTPVIFISFHLLPGLKKLHSNATITQCLILFFCYHPSF